MILYGLKKKTGFEFRVLTNYKDKLEPLVERSYWDARAMTSRGTKFEMDDYMKDYQKVKIEITEIKE